MAQALRALRAGGLYFDGLSAYAVVQPFTVYGWDEITIAEWIYPYWPKANAYSSKFSMIGDYWIDIPALFFGADNKVDYTVLAVYWSTRRADGSRRNYFASIYAYRNTWVHVVRRFTSGREYSVWVNGSRIYAATVPAEEKTVLEWDPDTATMPERYRRFALGANVAFFECMKMMYGEVRIYNRALTEDEIKAIYERSALIRDGLVLLLDFSEYEGDIAYDKSGCGNHASIYGARWVVKKALYRA